MASLFAISSTIQLADTCVGANDNKITIQDTDKIYFHKKLLKDFSEEFCGKYETDLFKVFDTLCNDISNSKESFEKYGTDFFKVSDKLCKDIIDIRAGVYDLLMQYLACLVKNELTTSPYPEEVLMSYTYTYNKASDTYTYNKASDFGEYINKVKTLLTEDFPAAIMNAKLCNKISPGVLYEKFLVNHAYGGSSKCPGGNWYKKRSYLALKKETPVKKNERSSKSVICQKIDLTSITANFKLFLEEWIFATEFPSEARELLGKLAKRSVSEAATQKVLEWSSNMIWYHSDDCRKKCAGEWIANTKELCLAYLKKNWINISALLS